MEGERNYKNIHRPSPIFLGWGQNFFQKINRKLLTTQARQLAQQACLLEEKAGDMLHPEPKNEPTRSILYKSGASLALQAGDYDKVRHLIAKGLIGHPPAQVIEEYNSLLAQIPQ